MVNNIPNVISRVTKISHCSGRKWTASRGQKSALLYKYLRFILCIQSVLILREINIISSTLVTSTQDKMSALYSKADARIPASLLLSSWGRRSLFTLPQAFWSQFVWSLWQSTMQGVYLGVVVPWQLRPHIAGQELAASTLRYEAGATRACKSSFSDPCGSSLLHMQCAHAETFPPTCWRDGQLFL